MDFDHEHGGFVERYEVEMERDDQPLVHEGGPLFSEHRARVWAKTQKRPCPHCEGRGKWWLDHVIHTCPGCDGRAWLADERLTQPDGEPHLAP